MEKRFLVTGSWFDKETGKPVSGMVEISKGLNKNKQAYEIANTDNRETIDGTYAVGTILNATMSITPDKAVATPPPQRSSKQ